MADADTLRLAELVFALRPNARADLPLHQLWCPPGREGTV